jgi:phage terminase large subunit-like protein
MCDLILQGKLTIDRTGLTTWCAANAQLEADAQGNQWFSKRRSHGRIDGMVALAMAIGGACYEPAQKPALNIFERDDLAEFLR